MEDDPARDDLERTAAGAGMPPEYTLVSKTAPMLASSLPASPRRDNPLGTNSDDSGNH
jgi:hypothetical protein